jgi:hypothetical protein
MPLSALNAVTSQPAKGVELGEACGDRLAENHDVVRPDLGDYPN